MKKRLTLFCVLFMMIAGLAASFAACSCNNGRDEPHTHTLARTAARAATCETAGNSQYWYCEGCGKYFADKDATSEIFASNAVIAPLGHAGGTATCVAYAVCERCGKPYGEFAAHSWDTKWTVGSASHWHACTQDGCEAITDETEHVDRNGDDYCDECEADMHPLTKQENVTDFQQYTYMHLGGYAGERFRDNYEHWLQVALDEDAAMLEVFYRKDEKESLVPWFGEFPGKYLVSLCYAYEMYRTSEIEALAERLLKCFDEVNDDGYLGPYAIDQRFTGHVGGIAENDKIWDLWGNYHIIIGLVKWYELTADSHALDLAENAANYIIKFFASEDVSYADTSQGQIDLAITHAFAKLYNLTQTEKYKTEAEKLINDYWPDFGGDWYNNALLGKEFYQSSQPRWEALHALSALAELYKATGTESYRTAFAQIWNSIKENDVHNAGSFTSNEQATGDPYADHGIETCCTIAWMEFGVEALKLLGDSKIADELERSQLNAVYASQLTVTEECYNLQYYTYDTPMNGKKEGAVKTLVWQSIGRAADVSCCQLNGPKGPSLMGQWGFYRQDGAYCLNYYGESEIEFAGDGFFCRLTQTTEYPKNGAVRLAIKLDKDAQFALKLRIPAWSQNPTVKVNGIAEKSVTPGTYLTLQRVFSNGDVIELDLGFAVRIEHGANDYTGCVSVFYGPLLLALDESRNPDITADEFVLTQEILQTFTVQNDESDTLILVTLQADESTITLCAYADAGKGVPVNRYGSYYVSWIKFEG